MAPNPLPPRLNTRPASVVVSNSYRRQFCAAVAALVIIVPLLMYSLSVGSRGPRPETDAETLAFLPTGPCAPDSATSNRGESAGENGGGEDAEGGDVARSDGSGDGDSGGDSGSVPSRRGSPATDALCSGASHLHDTGSRVAHLIVGNARTLHQPRAYQSIQTNFIEAFGGEYSTFMYIKLDDDPSMSEKKKSSPRTTEEQLKPALEVLRPTDVQYADNRPTSELWKDSCDLVGYNSAHARLLAQVESLRSGFAMIEAYEKAHGMRFDWVSRLRPDAAFVYPVKPWCFFHTGFSYLPGAPPVQRVVTKMETTGLYIDHAGLYPRSQADGLFHAMDAYDRCAEESGQLEWRYQNERGQLVTDIQAHLYFTAPGRKFQVRVEEFPVVLLRETQPSMGGMCQAQYNGGAGNTWRIFDGPFGPGLCTAIMV